MKSPITTHVLDTNRGRPAEEIGVTLEIKTASGWCVVAKAETNALGRIDEWFQGGAEKGHYRMTFNTHEYFKIRNEETFYPSVNIEFQLK